MVVQAPDGTELLKKLMHHVQVSEDDEKSKRQVLLKDQLKDLLLTEKT